MPVRVVCSIAAATISTFASEMPSDVTVITGETNGTPASFKVDVH